MNSPIQELMHEHEHILIALDIIDVFVQNVKTGKETDINDIRKTVDFIKIFADKCHHGKEEDMLFPALGKVGFPTEQGPVAVMLYEHSIGRQLVAGMANSVSSDDFAAQSFADNATSYTQLLRNHISKENDILFPMSDNNLPDSVKAELLERFKDFEETVIGHQKHGELHNILNELKIKYL